MTMMLLKLTVIYIYATCAGIACLTGLLCKWFNLNDVFYFFARLTIGLIFLLSALTVIDIIIGIFW